jgi:voltage-gated potassium channel
MADRSEIQDRRRALEQRRRARRELRMFMRRLTFLVGVLVVLTIAGAIGYSLTEGVSVGFGFAWTLDTITTVGSIPEPRDTAGRVLKAGLELLGIGTLFYAFVTGTEFLVTGQLSGVLDERRVEKMIDSYSDHYIICGFGRVGRQVARDLRAAGVAHVVIDGNPDNREAADAVGVGFIESEAADDEVLFEAGIERAKGIIACVDSDAENIFIALTARELRDDILIVARASAEDSEKKLLRAGADRVVSPYKTSGAEMARVALHPQVAGAFEVADFRMEEIAVSPSCEGVGRKLEDVRGTAMVVALQRASHGRLEPQPAPDTVIEAGDKLIALGTPDALDRLEEVFQPTAVATQ